MKPPAWFVQELKRDFHDRLRIRWSDQNREWLIEQKVGRAALPPTPKGQDEDAWIRAKDGYSYVMSIRTGDRAPCPICRQTLKVPVYEFRDTPCPDCSARYKKSVVIKASYWPLNDMLLEHLRKIDPYRDGIRRMVRDADAQTARHQASQERQLSNHVEAATKDLITTFGGMTTIGYTGKERYG